MESYSIYRLTDWDWVNAYKSRMGNEEFHYYVNSVYEMLLNMTPGDSVEIEKTVKTENTELFIKIVCMFITEQHENYDFSNDYKIIRCHDREEKMERKRPGIPVRKPGQNDNKGTVEKSSTNGAGS